MFLVKIGGGHTYCLYSGSWSDKTCNPWYTFPSQDILGQNFAYHPVARYRDIHIWLRTHPVCHSLKIDRTCRVPTNRKINNLLHTSLPVHNCELRTCVRSGTFFSATFKFNIVNPCVLSSSVADPDPWNPYHFPRSVSGSVSKNGWIMIRIRIQLKPLKT